ncbi:MAG TPA: metallophosphoesterase family protein [Candidatus Atribacteria bacterium]|nr:metallophosphoesterase family protein [Candidatus Atribacteria bacterium]
MKVAILADIHGNFDALERVSEEVEKVEDVVVLGDIIGYGAEPEECVRWVVKKKAKAVLGNHEAACTGELSLSWFNPRAAKALLWTQEHLSSFAIRFIQSLPLVISDFLQALWVHGSPRQPIEEYIDHPFVAQEVFESSPFSLCFFGHTHQAEAYVLEKSGRVERISFREGGKLGILPDSRYLINCGSVGQPRDDNPQASFAIFDTEKKVVEVKRVDYDISSASLKILRSGLPEYLAYRLELGR